MGADLYIYKLHNKSKAEFKPKFIEAVNKRDAFTKSYEGKDVFETPEYKALQEEVWKYFDLMHGDGYFRDSYNASGVAKSLGFSWWSDIIPMLNKKGNLSGKNLKKFYKMVSESKLKKLTAKQIKEYGGKVDNAENSIEAWNKSYEERQKELIAFIKRAIDLRTVIHCSL